jgi:uncharacterized protein (DUF2164 family)
MSDYKVNLVNDETPTAAEREQTVLENAGVETRSDESVYKVNLNQPPKQEQDAVQEQSTNEVPVRDEPESSQEVVEEVRSSEESTEEKEQVLELIKDEQDAELQKQEQKTDGQEIIEEKLVQKEEVVAQIELPENIQKVVDFMNETGGSLEDYVRLNTDYSNINESSLLKEYYKQTKSHLDNEEIDFLIEDNFSYDEDVDEERDIRRKKLAYKEEIAKARNFLNDLKGKYYDEVKLTSKMTPDQKEAIDFYNQYKKEQSELTVQQQKASEHFTKQTEQVFNQDFKGFDFQVGENKYRFKVSDVQQTKQAQSDIVGAFKTFLDDQNMLKDPAGYHKALFAARNADKLANHFYEQGKADAIKQLEAESKNINMDPRKTQSGFIDAGGLKVRAVTGDDSSKLRVKIRK